MVLKTWVQYQVESYQRLKKWNLMPPCLIRSIIRWRARVKWSNPENEVVSSPTPRCSSYCKRSLLVTLDYGHQLYFTFIANISIGVNQVCNVCFWMFVSYFCVNSGVSLHWWYSFRRGVCLTVQNAVFPLLVYEYKNLAVL